MFWAKGFILNYWKLTFTFVCIISLSSFHKFWHSSFSWNLYFIRTQFTIKFFVERERVSGFVPILCVYQRWLSRQKPRQLMFSALALASARKWSVFQLERTELMECPKGTCSLGLPSLLLMIPMICFINISNSRVESNLSFQIARLGSQSHGSPGEIVPGGITLSLHSLYKSAFLAKTKHFKSLAMDT